MFTDCDHEKCMLAPSVFQYGTVQRLVANTLAAIIVKRRYENNTLKNCDIKKADAIHCNYSA